MPTEPGRVSPRVAAMIAVLSGGCLAGEPPRVDPGVGASRIARAGCELVTRRCGRCHPLDRVLSARVAAPAQWRSYVHRMRLVPSSGIQPSEEAPMVACLVSYTFGATSAAALAPEGP